MNIRKFSEKQMRVLCWWCAESPDASCHALICDGAVRSGKTLCMSLSFVLWAFYQFENQSFAFCGKTIRSLKRNVIHPLMTWLREFGFTAQVRQEENLLILSRGRRSHRFYLFGGKDEGSASLIQGMTLAGVLLDEVALMPRSFVEQALARCSVEAAKFWFNCNPEGPQHWFYQEWIVPHRQKGALYLHFTMEDNPSLSKAVRERYQTLYAGTFYERFVLGKWTAAQGLIYPFMTGDRFGDVPRDGWEKYAISCDYGTVNPSSFGLWGKRGESWYRMDEYYYDARRAGCSRTDEEHYQGLCTLAGEREISCVVVDPSAASFLTVIRRHGRFRTLPAKNQVLDGIRRVSVALKQGEIRICRCCTDSIREFGLYRWNNAVSQDAPIKEHDHAMDDIRYFVTTVLDGDTDGFVALAAPRSRSGAWGRSR